MVRTAVDVIAGRVPVYVGAGGAVAQAKIFAREAEAAGRPGVPRGPHAGHSRDGRGGPPGTHAAGDQHVCRRIRPPGPGHLGQRGQSGALRPSNYWGGLQRSRLLAGICDTFGLGLSMHSNSHLGISLAAMVHLAGATPNLTYA